MNNLAERFAKTFHTYLLEHPRCVAWKWEELSEEHRQWKIDAARYSIKELGLVKGDENEA